MMRVVIYGAGKIGRGYLGLLMALRGIDTVFIDIDSELVAELNRRERYPVRILEGEGYIEKTVSNYTAIDAHDKDAVLDAIAHCDLVMTCVGANNLKDITPLIAEGLYDRTLLTGKWIDIIVCENLVDAGTHMKALMLKDEFGADLIINGNVGIGAACISCAAPVMHDEDKLLQLIDCYPDLYVDVSTLRSVFNIAHVKPVRDFDYYIKCKLFIHNMGHAACAYLGLLRGIERIDEAIREMDIFDITQSAMRESARAIAEAYHKDVNGLYTYVDWLIERFKNPALGDTCARVGHDPIRKLSPNDRLIGAMRLCEQQCVMQSNIAKAIAAALRHAVGDDRAAAVALLRDVSGLDEENPMSNMIMRAFDGDL